MVFDDDLPKEVSRRKLAEEALRLYDDRIKIFFHHNPVPLFVIRFSDGALIECNDSFCEIYGCSLQDLIGRNCTEFGLALNETSEGGWVLKLLQEKKAVRGVETTFQVRNGEILHGLFSLTLTQYGGEPCVLGMFQDITKSKLAAQRIRESERELNAILEDMQDTYYRTNLDGRVVRASPAVEALLQYSQEEVLGMRMSDLYVDPMGREVFLAALRASGGMLHGWEAQLRRKDGTTVWVSTNAHFCRDEEGNVTGVEGTTRDISERKRFEEEIKALANYDSLTGLPNRRLFYDRLQQVITQAHRSQRSAALLFIDLDGFKNVNDSLGHDAGDQLLQSAANRLSGCVRESDTVARIGGDEFVVIVPEMQDREGLVSLAEKILQVLSESFHIKDATVAISASVGVAIYPKDGTTVHELLKNSDLAMYQAKNGGRNACHYYAEGLKRKN